MKELPSQEYLKECFNYAPETGILTWKKRPLSHFKSTWSCNQSNSRLIGREAGTIAKNVNGVRYASVYIGDTKYPMHRVIWRLIHGVYPNQIDHINGNGLDNRACNLRSVTVAENMKNKRKPNSNNSGIVGVSFHKDNKTWQVMIGIYGKQTYLGSFKDKNDAIIIRKMAEYENGFHENHGRGQ